MQARTITIDDYEKLILFWKKNYFVGEIDNKEHFALFLEKNPDLSVLAEEEGEIVGSVLGSYDGRRGYLQKVVTDKDYRKQGIGRKLVVEVIKRLNMTGAVFVSINVETELIPFYKKCGFVVKHLTLMNLDLQK